MLWYAFVEKMRWRIAKDEPTRHEFGPVIRLEADALGEPGQRTFCLLAAGKEGSAALWLEKEELQALGVAIDQLLARSPTARSGSRTESRQRSTSPRRASPQSRW